MPPKVNAPTKKVITRPTKYEYKKGYIIPKASLTEDETINLINTLNVTPECNNDFAIIEDPSFDVYREDETNFYVPKFWGIDKFGDRFPQPKEEKNSAVNFNFNGKLRGSQPEVSEHILQKLKETNGGVLQLHTGYGKTTMAIYIASVLKLKTLVIVHKTFLQDQWYERIQQFTDASIGMIRQKKTDVEGRDIIIGMLQSISMIDYNPEIFKDIDLVIVDESHHAASKVFSRAFFKLSPKYTIALSATPRRKDGLVRVMHWFLGDTIIKVERKCNNVVYVKSFEYETINPLFTEKLKRVNGKLKPDTIKMTTKICEIYERNIFITNVINAIRFIPGRKQLVLSKRKAHLRILKAMMDKKIEDNVKNGTCFEDEYKTAFYVGGMKDWQLKASEEADIIFATYDMAEEGLDIDGLNTVVFASSIKDIIQALGRILRKPLVEGDINPLVIDLGDHLSFFCKWTKDRLSYYNQNKYKIDKIKVFGDACISMYDYLLKNKVIDAGEHDIDILRQKYIEHKFGKETYLFEKRMKFKNYPDSMFGDVSDLNKLFEITHDYSDLKNDQGSMIEYYPVTPK